MKKIGLILMVLSFMLLSCHHNSEPPTETSLSIIRQYVPETIIFQRSDNEFYDKIKWLNEKEFVVQSSSDFPDDKLGFSNAYKGIDFDRYNLLLYYRINDWRIDTYQNLYYRDNLQNIYNWHIKLGTSTIPDSNSETLRITRFAILVHKIPENIELNIWATVSAINFGWED